ncbi:hypothetical protein BBP40_001360 [Aspergillus hancockii]|nr:hypothetical protein BBP40_001360 [Aspergillus hancockii]
MRSVDDTLNASFLIIEICRHATGSITAATAMVCGRLVLRLSVTLASIASISHLTWAWAPDAASMNDRKYNVPIRAVWLPVVIVMVFACLNIANTAAFGAFVALSSIGLFVSYFTAISYMIHSRFRKDPIPLGNWNFGRWGLPVKIFALVYTVYVTVWLTVPSYRAVTGENLNYALPIFSASSLFPFVYWFLRGKKHWPGLNKEVLRLVVEGGELQPK